MAKSGQTYSRDVRRSSKMKSLIVATGGYGAGKTTFAKWYAKRNNGTYLDFELLYFERNSSLETFLERLNVTIKKSPSELFVIDGSPMLACLKDIDCAVRLCLCFAAPHVVHARQSIKASHVSYPLPISEETIKLSTYHRFNAIVANGNDPLFVDTTDGHHFVTRENFPQRWEELIFCSTLHGISPDRHYGDIELPSGIVIPGYTRSRESWDRLRCLIDFSGKDVLDLGCFFGYFSFKAEESGARSVVGVEINENAFRVANQIALLKKSRVSFRRSDIVDFEASCVYDIVLVLNMLHHVKDVNKALENIFECSKLVAFEMPTSQRGTVLEHAKRFGFESAGRANSHREGREITVLTNSQATATCELPIEYRYDYRIARLKKLPKEIAVSLVWKLEVHQPFKWLMRRYRSAREVRAKRLMYNEN